VIFILFWVVGVKKRIHIFGASGSGTTTLARTLSESFDLPHFDTDNYFWQQTDPPFQFIREKSERKELLRQVLTENESWVLSGSLCGWGDFTIPMFDYVVFLWLPQEVRMQRLKQREIKRNGPGIIKPKHPRHKQHLEFLEWAAAYDTGGLEMRSKSSHEKWIKDLPYCVLRIEGDHTIQENIEIVLGHIVSNDNPKMS